MMWKIKIISPGCFIVIAYMNLHIQLSDRNLKWSTWKISLHELVLIKKLSDDNNDLHGNSENHLNGNWKRKKKFEYWLTEQIWTCNIYFTK